MTNVRLIDAAVNLVGTILDNLHITENNASIRNRVLSWYNNTDVTDPELLAAAAMLGDYSIEYTYTDMLKARDYWFPNFYQDYVEYFEYGIHEIEAAQYDMFL